MILLVIGAGVDFFSFWTPEFQNYRHMWLTNMARFSTIFYIVIVMMVFLRQAKYGFIIGTCALLINITYCRPVEWTLLDYSCSVQGILVVGAISAVFWLLNRSSSHFKWILVVFIIYSVLISTKVNQNFYRYKFYHNTIDGEYDINRLTGQYLGASAAAMVDKAGCNVIDYVAEYGGRAWWWYRYPFMGSRLQNQVLYIPATESGQIWNKLNNSDRPKMSYSAWTKRLVSKNVSYVFCTTVLPIEADWMHSHPERFRLEQSSPFGKWVLYKIIK